MSKSLRSTTKRSGANRLSPKKGSAPKPHASPGRAAGARKTSTAPVKARSMGKSAGNSRSGGVGNGGMKRGMSSPLLMQNKR